MFKLLLIVVIFVSSCKSQSACPETFQYVKDGDEVQGLITFEDPDPVAEIHLKMQLSIAVPLPSKYVGALSLAKNREDARNDILNNRPLLYRVQFPVQNPIPKVTAIMYNNKLICSGQPDRGSYVTTINLEHTFYTGLQNQPSSFNYQPPARQPQNNYPQQPSSFNNQQPARKPQNNYPQQPFQSEATVPQTNPPTLPPATKPTTRKSTRPPTRTSSQSSGENHDAKISCGMKETTALSLIFGGDLIKRGDWPWLVAYYNNGKDTTGFICGGSLISANAIVTAAHCIQNKKEPFPRKAEQATFYIGKHNLNLLNEPGYVSSGAAQFNVHPSWNPNDNRYDADIAVVILLHTVQFSQYIIPICLWKTTVTSSQDVVDRSGTVVGWGKTEFNSISTDNPKEVEIPIVDEGVCLRSNDAFQKITSSRTFCAGKRDRTGPCNGDSGGALALRQEDNRYYLRGVVSAALGTLDDKCDVENYFVFTDAAMFTDWIKTFI